MKELLFEVDWTESSDPDPRRAGTSAELRVLAGGLPIMRQYSHWSKTITDRARVPIYPIAEWFAANWWRIHHEAPYASGVETPVDWKLSHDLAGIGGGLIWPNLLFSSDDRAVQVSTRPSPAAPWEPVRYLDEPHTVEVSFAIFDQAIETLITLVVARLTDLGVEPEPLATIWSHVLAERRGDYVEWRRWEARLGYDPDDAPEDLMTAVVELRGSAGQDATEEVLPLIGQGQSFSVDDLRALLSEPGVTARMPSRSKWGTVQMDGRPWKVGYDLARQVREGIGRVKGPLDDRTLGSLLGIDARALRRAAPKRRPLGLGVRDQVDGSTVLHFRKRDKRGRRFEAARFLADDLVSHGDKWLPLTDRGTVRQKMQRAFAAELLVPIGDLRSFLGNDRSDEKMDEVGAVYEVSTHAVKAQLVNHGLLAREEAEI